MRPSRRDLLAASAAAVATGVAGCNGRSEGGTDDEPGATESSATTTPSSADREAYETFESAVEAVASAAGEGDADSVRTSAARAFDAAITGSYALADAEATAGAGHVAALQARGWDAAALASMGGPSTAFAHAAALTIYRARTYDARWLAARGETDRAATMAGDVFAHFEGARAHEALEAASGEAYEGFEAGLAELRSAIESGDESAIDDAVATVDSNLVTGIEALAGANAPLLEAAFFRARFADARELYRLGRNDVAASIAQRLFQRFNGEALASIYAIVGSGGGSHTEAAAAVVQDVFAGFEAARVHELIEDADHNAYGTFEAQLEAYVTALQEGGDVNAAAASFASAAQYAQFALVDGVEKLPLDLDLAGTVSGRSGTSEGGGESALQGGPNVVDGVPDDADHVVDTNAVAYDPAEPTVSTGDTVAWTYAAGEPHSVTAYRDGIPDGATYWASGGFESEEAARNGWENGEGAVQSGESFVHTFETTGTHEYFCIPHEAAGMVGTVVVE